MKYQNWNYPINGLFFEKFIKLRFHQFYSLTKIELMHLIYKIKLQWTDYAIKLEICLPLEPCPSQRT